MEIEERTPSGFRCTVCGECCRGNQNVWLNPTDLLRLAGHLGYKDTGRLIDERIVVIEAGEHGVSRARLRFRRGPAGPACRFLVNDLDEHGRLWGKCSLHSSDAKPLVCRLAPLSRSVETSGGVEEWREVPPVIGCPGWGRNPPTADGREISVPELPAALRADLNAEVKFFRQLETMTDQGVSHDPVVEMLYRVRL